MSELKEEKGNFTYYLTYEFDPRYLDVSEIEPGDGIDLRDPFNPIKAELKLFPSEKDESITLREEEPGFKVAPITLSDLIIYQSGMNKEEHSRVLRCYFKATYNLASLDAGVDLSEKIEKEKEFVYILITHTGESRILASKLRKVDEKEAEYIQQLEQEDLKPEDVAYDFIARYGTHYVAEVVYGLRIGIEASITKSKQDQKAKVEASLKAAFGNFSAEAGINGKAKDAVESLNVSFKTEITSGGTYDSHKEIPVLTNVEEIYNFLRDFSRGVIQYRVAPITITLKPYWIYLDRNWKKLRSIFKPETPTPSGNLYGVPSGTIIAWCPKEDPTDKWPPGWVLCNGKNGTPDLRERFIYGTDKYEKVREIGGRVHRKKIRTDETAKSANGGKEGWKNVTPAIGNDELLPPYVKLIYIMKT